MKSKILVILLCSWQSILFAQNDSSILITDGQAKYFLTEHVDANYLRGDTALLMNEISMQKKMIADYQKIISVDKTQINFMQKSDENKIKAIDKLTLANTRWKRLAVVQLGMFTVSAGFILMLWHFK